MFQSARLKLTAWYLFIIMLVCLAFSAVIFELTSNEVDRFAAAQRNRFERRLYINGIIVPLPPVDDTLELVEDAKRRIILNLLTINGGILLLSGVLSYLLAGRTLNPIKIMVDDQNRFISDSSHELRTPLTSLKSALEVSLRDPKLKLKDAKEVMKESVDEVDRLTQLSNGLLTLARYQQSVKTISFAPNSLADIVALAIHKIKFQASQKHITLVDHSPDILVNSDKDNLGDAFVIFLDNAIKYSPDNSSITISSKRVDGSVYLSIKDQGIGIDTKDLAHIFDRFYRADTARSHTGAGGFGLGLSIAKKIIEAHHGSITVESQPGQGSNFIVKLPVFSKSSDKPLILPQS